MFWLTMSLKKINEPCQSPQTSPAYENTVSDLIFIASSVRVEKYLCGIFRPDRDRIKKQQARPGMEHFTGTSSFNLLLPVKHIAFSANF